MSDGDSIVVCVLAHCDAVVSAMLCHTLVRCAIAQ